MKKTNWKAILSRIDLNDYELADHLDVPRSTLTALRRGATAEPGHALGEAILNVYRNQQNRADRAAKKKNR